jgi:DNA-directed RNA polymerase subunit RPC12/RpoP
MHVLWKRHNEIGESNTMNETATKCKSCNKPYLFVKVIRTDTQTLGIYACPECGVTITK